MKLMKVTVN